MKEVDFAFLLSNLDEEIARLTNANNISLSRDAVPVLAGMVEYLSTLRTWLKSAIKVERDRIQGVKDRIDATLYELMSKSSLKFDDDFKTMLDHARGNAATWLWKEPTTPQRKTYTSSAVEEAANRLEKLRLKLKSRIADSAQQKITFVTQDSDLAYAVDLLTTIAEQREHEGQAIGGRHDQ